MKRLLSLLAAAILIVSVLGITTAFAGVSISGSNTVQGGKTYTYTVKISYTGFDMMGTVSCGGIFSGSSVQFGAGTSGTKNASLSDTVKITVKVNSSAKPGDKGTIKVSGQRSSFDGNDVTEAGISKSNSSKPTRTAAPTLMAEPTPTPEPAGWELAAIQVADMQAGGTVRAAINENAKIPASLLLALAEKKGVLEVDFGGYICRIDGRHLADIPAEAEELNLGMTMEKDPALSEAAGGKDIYQMHFAMRGELPGAFTYSFKAEESNPGDTVYLYYYYAKAGVLEGKQAAVVDEDGSVSFTIYHCSSYFVSREIVDQAMHNFTAADKSQADKAAALDTQPDSAQAQPPEGQGVSITEVSEQTPGFPLPVLIACIAAAALLAMAATMFVTKTGIFSSKRKTTGRHRIGGR